MTSLLIFSEACAESNPNMFLKNPCTCGSFYQCVLATEFGDYNVYEMPCHPCTCWSQIKQICDHDPRQLNPDSDKCNMMRPG